jgi:hypothetical protein
MKLPNERGNTADMCMIGLIVVLLTGKIYLLFDKCVIFTSTSYKYRKCTLLSILVDQCLPSWSHILIV